MLADLFKELVQLYEQSIKHLKRSIAQILDALQPLGTICDILNEM